ncbi:MULTISPECIES: hypothetical protein [unclassified Rathayibacter]|uniref:hypothetical protein n=1 Tax=unclassified Rathayibacter TaxID=2609250 RepID=UPI00131F4A05|nr:MULTISPECIES: hypothetical protein [unclassified Rathayibacter]QHC72539.1 hypothetical protein GSU40_01710 [Rathayibacter sp. VKM Ac-2805]QHF21292.1 hypothetical protein GTU71_10920 [Rathayibacter sp. VKM Ac-2762]
MGLALIGLGAGIGRSTDRRAVSALRAAIDDGDPSGIGRLLSPSVSVVVDPGRPDRQGARVVSGVVDAVRVLLHGTTPTAGRVLTLRDVNGRPGLVLLRGDDAEAVIGVDVEDGAVSVLWVRLHPDYRRHGNTT